MERIDPDNAERYLRAAGRVAPDEVISIGRLAGGVSNEVLYVAFAGRSDRDFVLKQARERLRVPEPWFCGVERIWREVDVLRICERLLDAEENVQAVTPRILFEDRENYCFAMTAAPREHQVWKRLLLGGDADPKIAAACGGLLGVLHGGTWRDEDVAAQLGDRQFFDKLRVDPYYRATAKARPEAAGDFGRLIASLEENPRCLVHADFSPKNLLVYPGGLMMVDFETGHYGDPAFDLGFFLSHLVLKSFQHAGDHRRFLALTEQFWKSYGRALAKKISPAEFQTEYPPLTTRAIANFAGCAWSRLDGKSGIDYLEDKTRRDQVRELCRQMLSDPPETWNAVLAMCCDILD